MAGRVRADPALIHTTGLAVLAEARRSGVPRASARRGSRAILTPKEVTLREVGSAAVRRGSAPAIPRTDLAGTDKEGTAVLMEASEAARRADEVSAVELPVSSTSTLSASSTK